MGKQLQQEKSFFEDIFQCSGDGIRIIGSDFLVVRQNQAMNRLSGVTEDHAVNRKCFHSFRHPFCKSEDCVLHRILEGEQRIQLETEQVRENGQKIAVELTATPLKNGSGEVIGVIESFRDISERKQTEKQLKYLSLHDMLTGIYNRNYFEREMCRLAEGRNLPVGVIICDLDDLKVINDTLGHTMGDVLIKATAKVINRQFRKDDIVARIGGDEFAVLLPGSDREVVENGLLRIKKAIKIHNAKNPERPLNISIGSAVSSSTQANMNELFEEADNNMYREKLRRKLKKMNS